ncbi:hypothetical protein Hte_007397 [Hypoxylon texense]
MSRDGETTSFLTPDGLNLFNRVRACHPARGRHPAPPLRRLGRRAPPTTRSARAPTTPSRRTPRGKATVVNAELAPHPPAVLGNDSGKSAVAEGAVYVLSRRTPDADADADAEKKNLAAARTLVDGLGGAGVCGHERGVGGRVVGREGCGV